MGIITDSMGMDIREIRARHALGRRRSSSSILARRRLISAIWSGLEAGRIPSSKCLAAFERVELLDLQL